jgi:hypothetical protein
VTCHKTNLLAGGFLEIRSLLHELFCADPRASTNIKMFAVSERERARRWGGEGREGREGASERETRGWWGWRERGREREIVRKRDRERERGEKVIAEGISRERL